MSDLRTQIDEAAQLMTRRRPVAVLTGAGVSVESGIEDFRSPGGLWERFDPMEYASIDAFIADPDKVWTMLRELGSTVRKAVPNAGRLALARLEELGVVSGIITQNIDNLHQRAGSKVVVEFHGNGARLVCLECGRLLDELTGLPESGAPRCAACNGVLRPDVVFFGEAIPPAALQQATSLSTSCKTMLVAGTSGTVAPASSLPLLALRSGASLVEVNLERTPLTDFAQISIRGRTGEVLPVLAEAVSERLGR